MSMSTLEGIPNPERFAPGSPWSTHEWGEDLFWGDSCSFCVRCSTPSFGDEAHEPCKGAAAVMDHSMPLSVLVRPRTEESRSAA
ncbi:hypothetical protein ACWDHW_06090 [Streptomyces melanosporofaciens]